MTSLPPALLKCPACKGVGLDRFGDCRVCGKSGMVQPYRMREACKDCGTFDGFIRKSGPGNSVRCSICWKVVYIAPKSETGEAPRSLNSRPDLPGGARDFVLTRANHRCELCGRGAPDVILQVAHALSIADCKALSVPEEEWHHDSNLLAACEECNSDMGARSLEPRQMARLLLARLRRGHQR